MALKCQVSFEQEDVYDVELIIFLKNYAKNYAGAACLSLLAARYVIKTSTDLHMQRATILISSNPISIPCTRPCNEKNAGSERASGGHPTYYYHHAIMPVERASSPLSYL